MAIEFTFINVAVDEQPKLIIEKLILYTFNLNITTLHSINYTSTN